MKKINILVVILIAFLFGVISVNAAKNPYKENGPYGTNCTWYALQKAYDIGGVAMAGFGNAKNWLRDAQNKGYTTGSEPRNNSIIVWADWTEYGHVGYVERVEGNKIYVWESNSGPSFDVTYIEPRV